jgi:predicted DNA-binding transcriptional regulator YafY
MPSNKSAIIRYRVIDQCLRNSMHCFPTKKYLRQKCEDALYKFDNASISISTIEKDIKAMKDDPHLGYLAPIEYDRARKGYYYTETDYSINGLPLSIEELEALKFAAVTLFQYRNITIFEYFKEAIDKIYTKLSLTTEPDDIRIDEFVHFEKPIGDTGTEWLQPIYAAIVAEKAIEFTYHNIYKNEEKQFTLVPYILKEQNKHWYLVGWYAKHDCYLIFSLDRIQTLTVLEKRVKKRIDFNPDKFFLYSSGIMKGASKPLKITLEVKPPVSKLLLLQPMHQTQQLIKEKKDYIVLTMEVVQSPELMNQLLSWGDAVKVVKPASLVQVMKVSIHKMAENYDSV